MILKLYNLNKIQIEQNISKKQNIKSQIADIDNKINSINNDLNSIGVNKHGAISDFKLLAIHQTTLKYEKIALVSKKNNLKQELKKYDIIIVNYQKEIEKYKYLLNIQEKEKIKKLEKYDEQIASEYMQSKFINNLNTKGTV